MKDELPNVRGRRPRRWLGGLAVGAGVVLLGFELMASGTGGERWFWIVVAALMIALGLSGMFGSEPD